MRVFFDTNGVIDLLAGNRDLVQRAAEAEDIYVSVITVMEFFSFSELSDRDKSLFSRFNQEVTVCAVSYPNDELVSKVADLRINHKLKLPDAIIAAQAMIYDAQLISSDPIFARINGLSVHNFSNKEKI